MARATILRIPDELKAEASAYAGDLGISMNALCAVALRDYLDARRAPVAEVRAGLPPESVAKPAGAASERTVPSTKKATATPTAARTVPRVGANQRCPCGSGKKYKQCHGARS